MKTLFVILLAILCSISFDTMAQKGMSKAAKKRWKSRKKSMKLETFKNIVEGYDAIKSETESYKRQVKAMSTSVAERQEEIQKLKADIEKAKEEFVNPSNNTTTTTKPETTASTSNTSQASSTALSDMNKGEVFKVQVGAFRNENLQKFLNHKRFKAEVDGDGTKKYTLGTFRDYWEADLFKKYIREIGLQDAWIVSYKDGKRVNMSSVLGEKNMSENNNNTEDTKSDNGDKWR